MAVLVDPAIEEYMKERRVRSTRARGLVITALQGADGPHTAAELHRMLRGRVPLSSIYRSLAILESAGLLARHLDAAGIARFELAEWLAGHHHHLVCLECGDVRDIELTPSEEATLGDLALSMATAAGYQAAGHSLEIEGLCDSCRAPGDGEDRRMRP